MEQRIENRAPVPFWRKRRRKKKKRRIHHAPKKSWKTEGSGFLVEVGREGEREETEFLFPSSSLSRGDEEIVEGRRRRRQNRQTPPRNGEREEEKERGREREEKGRGGGSHTA